MTSRRSCWIGMVVSGAVFSGLDGAEAKAVNQVLALDPPFGGESGGFRSLPEFNILKSAPPPTGSNSAVAEKEEEDRECLEKLVAPEGIGDVENRSFEICTITPQLTAPQPGRK